MANWDRTVFENALLGLLCEGPKHGYDICQRFAPGGDWAPVGELARSQVYALLKSLEAQGLAEATLQEGERGPARRVYAVTARGRDRFRDWVRHPVASIRGLRVELPLKIYFQRRLGLGDLDALLAEQEALLAARLDGLRAAPGRGDTVAAWVGELQEGLLEAGLEWLRRQRRRSPGARKQGASP